jgi:predicted nucleic acid-binding protein
MVLAGRVDAPLVTADRRLHARCRAADAGPWHDRVQLLQAA